MRGGMMLGRQTPTLLSFVKNFALGKNFVFGGGGGGRARRSRSRHAASSLFGAGRGRSPAHSLVRKEGRG